MSDNEGEAAFAEYFAESEEILQRVYGILEKFGGQKISNDSVSELYREIHTLKGTSQLFGLKNLGHIAHGVEACLEPIRQGKFRLERELVDTIFESLDLIELILKNPKLDSTNDPTLQHEIKKNLSNLIQIVTTKLSADYLIHRETIPDDSFQSINEDNEKKENFVIISEGLTTEEVTNNEDIQSEKKYSEENSLESSTIRVHVSLLDKLMNLTGEMVLARNQVIEYSKKSFDNELHSLTQRLDLITSELQDNVMRTRMQPIGNVFRNFQKVVREMERELEKSISLELEGKDTELDKSLIEAIKDPLTHIIRNSCDHGIEKPEIRKKNGKSEIGKIILRALHEGGQIIIEISDDGKGIDPLLIKEKAIEKRIISPDEATTFSEKQVLDLIFTPGFTTSQSISSVSGRGVGMDVVRTNIERVGGSIEIESSPNLGTSLKLKIPLTLAIIPAMIIKSENEFFAIPQVKLQELVRIDTDEDKTQKIELLQGHNVYRLRGDLLPLISCSEVMRRKTRGQQTIYNIVVLREGHRSFGLIVDEICDTADIVVKSLPTFLKKLDIFSGATLLGDGSVALIMDTQSIAQSIKLSHESSTLNKENNELKKVLNLEVTELLFFRLSHQGTFALPLVLVNRLEEFDCNDIEYSGGEKIIKYREGLLSLIFLNDFFNYGEEEQKEKMSVIVVTKNNRQFGLVVNEILDIRTSSNEFTNLVKEIEGFLGTIISDNSKIVTVIDAYTIIDATMGIKSENNNFKINNKNLLLVEDTSFFVKQIKKVLLSSGLNVHHASDGEEALKLISSREHKFDLILSDIEMPRMNGLTLAQEVRKIKDFSTLPMIALTTRFTEKDQQRGREAGFNRYLEKLRSDELLKAIHEVLGGN